MTLLITSKEEAIGFIEFNTRQEAESIVVTRNSNGTYIGERTFDDKAGPPTPASAAAARSAGRNAINADAAKIEITKAGNGEYQVVVT